MCRPVPTLCGCVERYVATWEEMVAKDGGFVRVRVQFECCECGRSTAVKILDDENSG